MMNAVANSRAIFLFVCVCGVGESEAFASFVLSLLIATHLIFALPIEFIISSENSPKTFDDIVLFAQYTKAEFLNKFRVK